MTYAASAPAAVGPRSRSYNPRTQLYNASGSSLRKFRAADTRVRAGAGAGHIGVVGDSIVAGTGAQSPFYDRASAGVLRSLLNTKYVSCGTGIVTTSDALNAQTLDARYSEAGSFNSVADGFFNANSRTTVNGSSVLTFGPVTCDTFRVLVRGLPSGGGTATATVDGAGSYSLSGVSAAGAAIWYEIPCGSLASHTLAITGPASNTVRILAVEGLVTANGFRVSKVGVGSQTSTNVAATPADVWNAYAFDVAFIQVGINDFLTSAGATLYGTNLATIAAAVRTAGGDPILVVPVPTGSAGDAAGWDAYRTKVYDVADAGDYAVLDLTDRWGTNAIAAAAPLAYYFDGTTHPNFRGYTDIGNAFADALPIGHAVSTTKTASTIFTDNTTRTDSASAIGTPSDSGVAYTTAGGGTWGISSNKIYQAVAGSNGIAVRDAGRADGILSVDISTVGSNNRSGLAFRYADANNYWHLTPNRLRKYVAGVTTDIVLSSAYTSGDTVKAYLIGATIIITRLRSGVSTVIATASDNAQIGNTKHGVYIDSDTSTRFTNVTFTGIS